MNRERERKDLRDNKRKTSLNVPPVVGIVIVSVQPATIVIAIHAEQVQVAIRNV